MRHQLKIEPEYLANLLSGIKKSEIRINDRDYQKGDLLEFKEYKDCSLHPFFKHIFEITHVHSGLGLERNYVVLSLELID